MIIGDWYLKLPLTIGSLSPLSVFYAAFLLAVFVPSRIFSARLRPLVLVIANVLFLLSFSQYHLYFALVLSAIGYISSLFLMRYPKKSILFLSIFIYIGTLCYLKHPALFSHSLSLPLGISFYSFKIISYLADLYRQSTQGTRNPLIYFSYVLFFPAVTAGPIHRFDAFYDTISMPQELDYTEAKNGGFLMILGIYEKIVFCDYLGLIAAKALSPELSGYNTLLGVFLYSLQIYLDFDSYSNIAIGSARLLGFDLGRNFHSPYLAGSLKEFWRRWHISLSSFFRDYVYIPLGGNRKGKLRTYFNLIIVFLLSGLWHGTGFHFVLWGLLHALLQIAEDLLVGKLFKKHPRLQVLTIPFTFVAVSLLWLVFRSSDIAEVSAILQRIATRTPLDFTLLEMGRNEIYWMIAVIGIVFVSDVLRNFFDMLNVYSRLAFPLRWIGYAVLVVTFLIFGIYGGSFEASDFIYQWF